MATVEEKIKQMRELLGDDVMTDVLRSVIQKEKTAQELGLVAKEKKPVTGKDLVGLTPDQIIELGMTLKELQDLEDEEDFEEKEASPESEAMKGMLEEMKGYAELMKGYAEQLKGFGGGRRRGKPVMEDEEMPEEEEEDAPVAKKKEATTPLDPNIAKLAQVVKELTTQVANQGKLLEQITQAPVATRGYRPSQDTGNLREKETPVAEANKEAAANGIDGLVSFMLPNGR